MSRIASNRTGRLRQTGIAGAVLALGLSLTAIVQTATPTDASPPAPPPAGAAATSPELTPSSFARPPGEVRPMYRYWMPLAFTDDDVIRSQLRELAAAGAGGIEVVPFIVPGAGNQSNAFVAQYGWGTPLWAHKMEVITGVAADLGLVVDQNLGPHYPPTVPTLNSFNQPEAQQQLIYGREFNDAGSSRSGALPAPLTAPPVVNTTLCQPVVGGSDPLGVRSLGGFAPDDVITLGSGGSAEQVTVVALGDRTDTCGELEVSPVAGDHPIDTGVRNVALTHRIATVVAQCEEACAAGGAGPIALDASSIQEVTDEVEGGALAYTFPAGNGNPWVVIDFQHTASGAVAQSGGYTVTQPNYVVNHLSTGGVDIQAEFWDEHILTPTVRENLQRIGKGALFEDSLELGGSQKWTHEFRSEFEDRRGYDLADVLPALAGIGAAGTGAPAFELDGIGLQAREDYRQTLSDLYVERYVTPMQQWAQSNGLEYRVQAYGFPISTAQAASVAGIPEGESLNFGSPDQVGAEQNFRAVAAGAHFSGRNIVSTECCAVFQGNYRSTAAGAKIRGQFGEGGDGSNLGGRLSQGLLDSIYKSYAGGVNQVVWHGLPYRDAPQGVGTAGRDGSWPGYKPWDIFGILNAGEDFGSRQASWPDHEKINDNLARTQLVLRQGRATLDLGVYYEDLGLNAASTSAQQPIQHMLANDSATASAGYTYEYVAPEFLHEDGLTPDADGGLFGDRSDHDALVLNDQQTISVRSAQRLAELAQQGLRIFVVGEAPSRTTGREDQAALASAVSTMLAQPTVIEVDSETDLPSALRTAGIVPTVTPNEPSPELGLVRRNAGAMTYDFIYNRTDDVVERDLTLTGSGTPYLLDTWSGEIKPVGEYERRNGAVTVPVRVAPYDNVIIALAPGGSGFGPAPSVHATDSTTEVRVLTAGGLALRATGNGAQQVTLSNGVVRNVDIAGLPPAQALHDWSLQPQSWTPGNTQYQTVKTDYPRFALDADDAGRLSSWLEIASPVDLTRASGLGVYTTRFDLPEDWDRTSMGAYLDLGEVVDTVRVSVNGTTILVNQGDRSRIDLSRSLRPGENQLRVRVATTLFNAVRHSGDSNYSSPPWQDTGLMGPIVLTPYQDVPVDSSPDPGPKTETTTNLTVKPKQIRPRQRATARIRVRSTTSITGSVELRVNGIRYRTVTARQGVIATKLPRLALGRHVVTAHYLGSDTHRPSVSKGVRLRVARPRATTTRLNVTPRAVRSGQPSTARVVVRSPGRISGRMRIIIDGRAYRTIPMRGRTVRVALPRNLSVGAHTVRARYLGSRTHRRSRSAVVSLSVRR